MPASNARALEKARTLACDVVVLDLEDAVAPDAKHDARAAACAAVAQGGFGHREVVVRINALDTQWGEADVAALARTNPDAVILPKVLNGADIARLHRLLPAGIKVWAMIETARGLLHLSGIAESGAACLVLGSNDLIKDMQARAMPGRENLWAAMSQIVLAARGHGLAVIDGTYNAIADADGLAASCEQGRDFGFDGKTLIHPGQIETANRIFAPDVQAIAAARRILAAFAQAPGKSVIALDGKMVETLHAEEAARLLALAEAIESQC